MYSNQSKKYDRILFEIIQLIENIKIVNNGQADILM